MTNHNVCMGNTSGIKSVRTQLNELSVGGILNIHIDFLNGCQSTSWAFLVSNSFVEEYYNRSLQELLIALDGEEGIACVVEQLKSHYYYPELFIWEV